MENNNTPEKKKPFGIERFYKKVFTLVLGSFLMLVPFYPGTLKMLMITEKEVEWEFIHTVFLTVGIILFVGGVFLNRFAELGINGLSTFLDKFKK